MGAPFDCIDYTEGHCDLWNEDCAESCNEGCDRCDDYIPQEDTEPQGVDLFS